MQTPRGLQKEPRSVLKAPSLADLHNLQARSAHKIADESDRLVRSSSIHQRFSVDPFENGNSGDGKEFGDGVEAFDGVIIYEEQGKQRNVDGDEELPEKVDLAAYGHDRFDERAFLKWCH